MSYNYLNGALDSGTGTNSDAYSSALNGTETSALPAATF